MVQREHREIRLLPEPVTGFRIWCIDWEATSGLFLERKGNGLWSINPTYGEWHPGTNQASCMRHGLRHHPAEINCGCGFWIKNTFKAASTLGLNGVMSRRRATYVVGAAMGWGRVQKHLDGWRCEYAAVLALGHVRRRDEEPPPPATIRLVKQLCLRYDVPLVADLQSFLL